MDKLCIIFLNCRYKPAKKIDEPVDLFLEENPWQFSAASSGQIMMSAGLGVLNLVGALVLGNLLTQTVGLEAGGLVGFVQSIYWLLLTYGIGFLGIPLGRYFWIQSRNQKNCQSQPRASRTSKSSRRS